MGKSNLKKFRKIASHLPSLGHKGTNLFTTEIRENGRRYTKTVNAVPVNHTNIIKRTYDRQGLKGVYVYLSKFNLDAPTLCHRYGLEENPKINNKNVNNKKRNSGRR